MSGNLSFSFLCTQVYDLDQQAWHKQTGLHRVSQQKLKISTEGSATSRLNIWWSMSTWLKLAPGPFEINCVLFFFQNHSQMMAKSKYHSQFLAFSFEKHFESALSLHIWIIVICWHNSLKWLPTSILQESWAYFDHCSQNGHSSPFVKRPLRASAAGSVCLLVVHWWGLVKLGSQVRGQPLLWCRIG